MKREDYERQPPPKNVVLAPYADAFLIASWVQAAGLRGRADGKLSVVLELDVPGVPRKVGVLLDGPETTDELIQCLIAARNRMWPTP